MLIPSIRMRTVVRMALIGAYALLIVGLMCSARPLGRYRTTVVLSGSMEPTLRTGSLLITRKLRVNEYRVGDVVAFKAPAHGNLLVVHRLVRIYLNETGVWMAETKGDANSNGDAWEVSMGSIEGKMAGAIPFCGYLVSWTKTSFGFLVFVLLSFFLCVLSEMRWIAETFGRRVESA